MVIKSLGDRVSKYPKITITIILAITFLSMTFIGVLGIDQEFSESSFMPEHEVIKAQDAVSELFSTSNVYSVSILVKGENNDVLTSAVLVEMLKVEREIVNDSLITPTLMNPENPSSNANSVADILGRSILAGLGITNPSFDEKILALESMDDEQIKQTVSFILESDDTPAQVKGLFYMLLTKDFSPKSGVFQAKGTLISISLNGSLNEDPEGEEEHGMSTVETPVTRSEEQMDKIVRGMTFESSEMRVMGMSLIMNEIMEANSANIGFLLPMAFIMVILVLALVFRSGMDMLFSLLALVMGIIWMYGFGTALGYSFNPMTTVVPVLIVGLGIDYGIHLTMRHREELGKGSVIDDAVNNTIKHVGMALLLVTITTVAAFLSSLASPMAPIRDFGIIAAIGIVSCFFTMVTFVPACLHIRDSRRAKKKKKRDEKGNEKSEKKESKAKKAGVAVLDKTISAGAVAAEHHPKVIILVVLLVSAGAVYSAINLKTTFDFTDFLPDNLEITDDLNYMLNEFQVIGGEAEEVQILVRGDITNPDLLRDVGETIDNMGDDKHVIQSGEEPDVVSILSVMKDWATNSTPFGFSDPNYDPAFAILYNNSFGSDGMPLSDTSQANITTLYDWLYSNPFSNRDIRSVLHRTEGREYDAVVLRISVDITAADSEETKELMNSMDEHMTPLESSADSAVLTGGSIVTTVILDMLNNSQVRSLFVTLLVSLVFLTIVFRLKDKSFLMGTLTILPVTFCVLWTLGSMYLLDISLNIMTLMVTSLTIGIGVDYGIHISHRFAEDLGRFDSIDEACRSTVSHTGTALFGGAATTIAGFGLLVFATLPPLQQFGIITALTIFYSFIASVFVLPTFLVMWAKRKKRKEEEKDLESPQDLP
ncbi:MAG: MMPL family transporter [Thermoplasmata archaeon]|nr:MAG: MMPL family transporter [Thermoplasmata archaeon]